LLVHLEEVVLLSHCGVDLHLRVLWHRWLNIWLF